MNAASRPETEARAEVHYTLQQGAKPLVSKQHSVV